MRLALALALLVIACVVTIRSDEATESAIDQAAPTESGDALAPPKEPAGVTSAPPAVESAGDQVSTPAAAQ
ncbi:hypothetical protein KIN20_029603 [Parelaphostrongylus tenuis]|uniref:Uncharacterized protein n=1 Tax=Parelaphostrongylus tenuis TaxID=148309 RepID=A0AAD5R2V4_PARTN|nr:hypothetical protein KIN20_029603 [Parelaphostrongylus tenuis]